MLAATGAAEIGLWGRTSKYSDSGRSRKELLVSIAKDWIRRDDGDWNEVGVGWKEQVVRCALYVSIEIK